MVIAVIDPRSKVLLTDGRLQLLTPRSLLPTSWTITDNGMSRPGALRNNWQNTLNGIYDSLPRQAVSGIRVYERYFYLKQ